MKNISVLSLSLLNRLIVSLVIMISVISVFLGFASNARAQTCPAGLEFFDNLLDGSGFVFPSATNGSTTDNFGRTWKWNITGNTSNFACGSTPTLANGRLQHCYDWVNPGDGINVTATVTGGAVTNPVVFLADIDGGAPGLGWQDEFTWNSPAATAFTPAQNPYSFDISGSTFTGNANNADNSNYGAGSMLVTTGTSTNSFSYTYRAGPDTNPPGGQFVWVSFGSCMSVTPETTKTADAPSPAYPGDTVTYTVTITSPDDWDVAYNGFVDTLGSALEAKSVDLVNSTCAFVGDASISAASPGNTISWTSGAPYFIPKSTSCTIIYTAEIDPNLSIGSALTCDGIPGDDANDNLINIDFTNINGSSNITANSCFTITSANPELTLSKTASAVSYNAVGNVITYTYSIENTGDVVITEDILIEDDKLASDVTCTTVDLAVSGTIECEATYSCVRRCKISPR